MTWSRYIFILYLKNSNSLLNNVIYLRPEKGKSDTNPQNNLFLWNTFSGDAISSFFQKSYKKGVIQWTADEKFMFKLVNGAVQVFNGENIIDGPVDRIAQKGASLFAASSNSPPKIAVFSPESSGKAASVSIYSISGSGNSLMIADNVVSRSLMAASEASLLWNFSGDTCLIHTQSDVDTSNSSYYGATGTSCLSDFIREILQLINFHF